MKSWAAMPLKLQWQKFKNDCLVIGLISVLSQQFNKAFIYSKKSITTFPAYRWLVIDRNTEET